MATAATDLPAPALTNTASNDEVYEFLDENGNIVEYDMSRLHFCETVPEKIPSSDPEKPPMINYRINIQDKRADGRLQDLLIRTDDCFTYGVSESFDQKTGELNGYSFPMPMWDQDGATPKQKYFTDLLEVKILGAVKDHLVNVRKTFKQPDLELRDLRKMKMFYRKKDEDGAVNLGDPPTWYPKLIVSKKKNMKIVTRFYLMDDKGNTCIDEEGNPVELDPMRLKEKWGRGKAVVKIESIYIRPEGCSVQMKVWEADYRPTESALPRKGKVNKTTATVVRADDETNPLAVLMMANRAQQSATEDVVVDATGANASGDEHVAQGGDITVTDSAASPAAAKSPSTASAAAPAATGAATGAAAAGGKKVVRKVVVKKPAAKV